MPASQEPPSARASARTENAVLEVVLEGPWRLHRPTPRWGSVVAGGKPPAVRLRANGVSDWDTSLVVFVGEALAWCRDVGVPCDVSPLPTKMTRLAGQFEASMREEGRSEHSQSLVVEVGLSTRQAWKQVRELLSFVGDCSMDSIEFITGQIGFRWSDCLAEMQKCGAMALPIVALISFLVGVTLAYSGSIVLKRFGANIWVADLIGCLLYTSRCV